jgi:hypothetical protein
MNSKIYSTIVISSILGFALIAAAGISTTAFVIALAQEGTDIDMSMDNSTMMNATLAYGQGEESKDTNGTTDDGDTDMIDGLGNNTGGIPEGKTDPNGEGTDLGTGGP